MLVQSRLKHFNRKLTLTYHSTASPENSPPKINPEIQALVNKLHTIQTSILIQRSSHLNLIQWEKDRYRPSESENRMTIENRIALIKIGNQPIRSRIKPIKRKNPAMSRCYSQQTPNSYKDHYKQIQYKQNTKQDKMVKDSLESEEDCQHQQNMSTDNYNFKYYKNVKKYPKIAHYIQEQIEIKNQEKKNKSSRTIYYQKNNQTQDDTTEINSPSRVIRQTKRSKDKIFQFDDQETNCKVKQILQKWKPPSKMQQKFQIVSKLEHKKIFAKTFFKTCPEPFKFRLQKCESLSVQKRSNCQSQFQE